jgi:hypothetical protein
MIDPWTENEWQDLCQRLHRCADFLENEFPQQAGRFRRQSAEFCDRPPPERYPDLLQRVRAAAKLAVSWRNECITRRNGGQRLESESAVDEMLDESFPASDPPSWTTAAI